jgi:predicted ATP-grasp superfamily ATP-dependent carboligase
VATHSHAEQVSRDAAAVVIKPDDGAGCVETYVVRGGTELTHWRLEHAGRTWAYEALIAGEPRSLCILCSEGGARLICCNRQHIMEEDGKLGFAGVTVNEVDDGDGNYARLAQSVATAIPELWGHVGIDFVETGNGPVVIEINPRMTTACVGLRAALGINLGALVLQLPESLQQPLPPPGSGRPIHIQASIPSTLAGESRGDG